MQPFENLEGLKELLEANVSSTELIKVELPAVYWYNLLELVIVGGARVVEIAEEDQTDPNHQLMVLGMIYLSIYEVLNKAAQEQGESNDN